MSSYDSPTCDALSLSPIALPPPSVALNLAAYTHSVSLSLLLSFHPHHMPLILYPLTLLARFAYTALNCHCFPLLVSEVRPKGRCFISRRIVLSGSLFGLLGFIGFTLPEQKAWEPSELKASHWLMFFAELPS
ncbi:hypothetical protein EDB85DRAFT_1982788 [Lactarius pseudohatsudake]|nr:hypothetical protein EDB85DRAFT_1982788 [Lactarius pseudohatsudake]